ncbi:hypothetical protein F1880_002253 [Penicillium rolfsii]|nr:hypothetical protein F1880_002253 [Penicillium rolfsii]
MSPSSSRPSWSIIGALTILAISTVHAHPILESTTEDQAQPIPAVLRRDPRLIPDTEHYLSEVFNLLGVSDPTRTESTTTSLPTPTSTETASETPSATNMPNEMVKVEHGKAINVDATPVVSGSGVTYSATIKHGSQKPIENIQIGSGYHGGKKLAASDLPFIFAAVETEIASRWRNLVDSSDELGLDDEFAL